MEGVEVRSQLYALAALPMVNEYLCHGWEAQWTPEQMGGHNGMPIGPQSRWMDTYLFPAPKIKSPFLSGETGGLDYAVHSIHSASTKF